MAAFDLVIFDCDGVLVDSEVIACRAVAETLASIGRALAAEEVAARFVGISDKDMYAALEREQGAPLPASFEAEMNRRAAALFARELAAIAGAAEMLSRLTLPGCVASGSTPEMLERKLRWTGLARWFGAHVFSAASVARGKPAPDLFLYAAERVRAAPERCLVIEDSRPGIIAAKAAGMTAFGFVGGSHCQEGHGEALSAAGADLVFARMAELPGLIAERTLR